MMKIRKNLNKKLEGTLTSRGQLTKLEKSIKSIVDNKLKLPSLDQLVVFLRATSDFQKNNWNDLIAIENHFKNDDKKVFKHISVIIETIKKSGRSAYKTTSERELREGDIDVIALKKEMIGTKNIVISTPSNQDGSAFKIDEIKSLANAESFALSGVFEQGETIAKKFFQKNSNILLEEIEKLREILKR